MQTPVKTVRIPEDLRDAIRTAAHKMNSNESVIIRRALRAYLAPPSPREQVKHEPN